MMLVASMATVLGVQSDDHHWVRNAYETNLDLRAGGPGIAVLSNTATPRDTTGKTLITGTIFVHNNYARDGYWGSQQTLFAHHSVRVPSSFRRGELYERRLLLRPKAPSCITARHTLALYAELTAHRCFPPRVIGLFLLYCSLV